MKAKLFFLLTCAISNSFISYCEKFNYERQNFSDAQKNEMAPCRKYWGNDLVCCMEKKCTNKEIFKRNLLYLDDLGQRLFYFEQTLKSSSDYKKLDSMYTNTSDWQVLWNAMSKEEKENFFKNTNGLVALTKDNLKVFIKDKEDAESYDFKKKVAIGVAVGGAVLVFTPAGSVIVGAISKIGGYCIASKTTTVVTAATVL